MRTSKDHVDEIMSGSHLVESLIHKDLVPMTDYWKKVLKTPIKDKKKADLVIIREDQPIDGPLVRLFPSQDVQKEIVRLLLLFISTSNIMLVSKPSQDPHEETKSGEPEQFVVEVKKELPLESIKSLLTMRLLSSLIVLLLSRVTKDLTTVLESLRSDLNGDTSKLSKFLKHYFATDCSGADVLSAVRSNQADAQVVQMIEAVSLALI